ncbi:Protein of unknown function [Gryllus bimaculatus]|nr:Protein of unknown function [Gryllus bimaculatus]
MKSLESILGIPDGSSVIATPKSVTLSNITVYVGIPVCGCRLLAFSKEIVPEVTVVVVQWRSGFPGSGFYVLCGFINSITLRMGWALLRCYERTFDPYTRIAQEIRLFFCGGMDSGIVALLLCYDEAGAGNISCPAAAPLARNIRPERGWRWAWPDASPGVNDRLRLIVSHVLTTLAACDLERRKRAALLMNREGCGLLLSIYGWFNTGDILSKHIIPCVLGHIGRPLRKVATGFFARLTTDLQGSRNRPPPARAARVQPRPRQRRKPVQNAKSPPRYRSDRRSPSPPESPPPPPSSRLAPPDGDARGRPGNGWTLHNRSDRGKEQPRVFFLPGVSAKRLTRRSAFSPNSFRNRSPRRDTSRAWRVARASSACNARGKREIGDAAVVLFFLTLASLRRSAASRCKGAGESERGRPRRSFAAVEERGSSQALHDAAAEAKGIACGARDFFCLLTFRSAWHLCIVFVCWGSRLSSYSTSQMMPLTPPFSSVIDLRRSVFPRFVGLCVISEEFPSFYFGGRKSNSSPPGSFRRRLGRRVDDDWAGRRQRRGQPDAWKAAPPVGAHLLGRRLTERRDASTGERVCGDGVRGARARPPRYKWVKKPRRPWGCREDVAVLVANYPFPVSTYCSLALHQVVPHMLLSLTMLDKSTVHLAVRAPDAGRLVLFPSLCHGSEVNKPYNKKEKKLSPYVAPKSSSALVCATARFPLPGRQVRVFLETRRAVALDPPGSGNAIAGDASFACAHTQTSPPTPLSSQVPGFFLISPRRRSRETCLYKCVAPLPAWAPPRGRGDGEALRERPATRSAGAVDGESVAVD